MASYACADVSKIPYFGKDICVHANQIPPKRPPFSLTLMCSKKTENCNRFEHNTNLMRSSLNGLLRMCRRLQDPLLW